MSSTPDTPSAPADKAPSGPVTAEPGFVWRRFTTEKHGLPRLAQAPTMTVEDFQRLLRERAEQQPGTPRWHDRERQRLESERLDQQDGRFRERQQRDDLERRELERRRLERR